MYTENIETHSCGHVVHHLFIIPPVWRCGLAQDSHDFMSLTIVFRIFLQTRKMRPKNTI